MFGRKLQHPPDQSSGTGRPLPSRCEDHSTQGADGNTYCTQSTQIREGTFTWHSGWPPPILMYGVPSQTPPFPIPPLALSHANLKLVSSKLRIELQTDRSAKDLFCPSLMALPRMIRDSIELLGTVALTGCGMLTFMGVLLCISFHRGFFCATGPRLMMAATRMGELSCILSMSAYTTYNGPGCDSILRERRVSKRSHQVQM